MTPPPFEPTIFTKLLEWAWAFVVILLGIVWKRHNQEIAEIKGSIQKVDNDMADHAKAFDARVDTIERATVPRSEYEQNRREMREGQIQIFRRLDHIGQAVARIEGKLDQ